MKHEDQYKPLLADMHGDGVYFNLALLAQVVQRSQRSIEHLNQDRRRP